MHKAAGKKIPKIILKSLLYLLMGLLGIIVISLIIIQFPRPQKYITGKLTTYISRKINSRVELGKISIAFPKDLSLTDLYIEDLHQDTLLYAHSIKVNLNLVDLFSKKLELKDVSIEKLTAHVYREFPDTLFNYSFIPAAFISADKTKEPVENDTTSGFQFSIKNVELKSLYLTYHDTLSGTNADVLLGTFKTRFDEFSLTEKKIHIAMIQLRNTALRLTQFKPLQTDTSASQPFDYDLGVKEIELEKVKAIYSSTEKYQDLRADIGKLIVKSNKLDLKKGSIDLKSISLSESAIAYTLVKNITPDTVVKVVTQKEPGTNEKKTNWVIRLSQLDLKANSFSFDNKNDPIRVKGIDYSHLKLYNVYVDSKDIYVSPGKINLVLNDLRLRENKGLVLTKFKTTVAYDSTHIELAKLNLETDKSKIGPYLGINFKSIASIKDSIGSLHTTINLQNTRIALSDVLLFKPDLLDNPNLTINPGASIHLNCMLTGMIDDLLINQLEVSTLNTTALKLRGHIKKIREPRLMYADVQLLSLTTGKNDIENVLNPKLTPANISIPSDIFVKGSFKGYTQNFDGDAAITTSFGKATVSIKMNPSFGNKEQTYIVETGIDNFDLGKLLNNSELFGPLTLHAAADGRGLSDSTIHAQLKVTVQEATLKKYVYKNLIVEGTIDKKSFDGKASINDTNLAFNYSGVIDLDTLHPKYNFTFNLLGADLKALQLSKDDMRISALIQSDLKKENTENMTGTAVLKNATFIRQEKQFRLDSILLTSDYQDGIADISLQSELMNANLKGDINLKQLPTALKQHLGNYFDLQQKDTLEKIKPQKFVFEINITDPTLLTEGIVPQLEKLTPFSIKGQYDSEAKNIQLDMNLPQLVYSKIIVDSMKMNVSSTAEALNCELKIAEVSNPTLKLENIFLNTRLSNNHMYFQLNSAKDDSTKMLSIAGTLKSINETFNLHLEPALILNNLNWNVDTSNYLAFGKSGIVANKVVLTHEQQSIALNNLEKKEGSPLEIKFTSFELQTLSKIIENKKELINGSITGTVVLKKQNEASTFTSDIDIKKLVFNGIPTGDIRLVADNTENAKKFTVKLSLTGNENDITVNGFYLAESSAPTLNFLLDIRQLNLKTIEPYTFGQVTQMSGSLNGKMNITGSTTAPDLNGALNFNSCAFRPKIIDSYLLVENEKIVFDSKKIKFDSFTLVDSLKNKAILDGYADIQNLKSIPFDIGLKTTNFLALNTTEKDNPLYFGTVYLDSDIKLKGTTDNPIISGKIGLNNGTVITYVKPENASGENDSKGIVEFIDTIQLQKNIMTRQQADAQVSTTKGVSINALINLDKDAEFKMLVDRAAGDSLYIKGSGQLEFAMDEGGKMNLVGKYRINEGGYHLTVNDFIKKNFTIAKGGSVTWSGDVTDPYVDIKAVYKIKASPVDLVEDELTGADQLEKNKYRTLMTFLVDLKMIGFVSTPQISFDIEQPANERGALNGAVNAKLNELRGDESKLNKQVFALLTLNRFISDDPTSSNGASGLSSTSRASASRVLTQQLSNLSEKYVKGVDLNLGVNSYEDYSSGQEEGRTQLQLGVSKKLLNDKVTVQVGGNVDIEGDKAKENNVSDVASNINIEYKLTDDGRYKLKGFRENGYEDPIEGELTKTGFGIMYRRNYNKLKELFSKPEPKKKITK